MPIGRGALSRLSGRRGLVRLQKESCTECYGLQSGALYCPCFCHRKGILRLDDVAWEQAWNVILRTKIFKLNEKSCFNDLTRTNDTLCPDFSGPEESGHNKIMPRICEQRKILRGQATAVTVTQCRWGEFTGVFRRCLTKRWK